MLPNFLTSANSILANSSGCLGKQLEKAMASPSSTLAWKIPWTEESGRLQSMGSWRVGHDWVTSLSLFTFMHWRRKWQTHSSVLAWRIPGTGEPGGLPSMGSHRVGNNWSDLAAAAAGYKINLQKSVIFLYTNNVYTNNQKEKLRKQSHLQLHQKE